MTTLLTDDEFDALIFRSGDENLNFDDRMALKKDRTLLLAVAKAALTVVVQNTGDVFTDDHGWVRPILPGTVNALETALACLDRKESA